MTEIIEQEINPYVEEWEEEGFFPAHTVFGVLGEAGFLGVTNPTVLFCEGQDVTKLASMCKLKAGRLARELTDKCLQFWGGMGFTNEVLVSRFFRDFRLLSIGGGADEVMLSIICKYMRTLPTPPQLSKK